MGRARSAEFVVVKEWESGARYDLKYVKRRKGTYEELNTLVWEWFNKAQFTTYILCSHFQYTVTRVPNLCIAVHGNVQYMYMYIVLTCLLKLAPCLVINLAPSDEGTPAM